MDENKYSDLNLNQNHVHFMQLAIQQALLAKADGEIPVGAVVVDIDGRVIGKGYNQTISNNDPSAHAEIMAIRQASKTKSNYRLPNTSIYVTLEPCMMCLGAILHARVKNLIYGASDNKTGVCGGHLSLHQQSDINHQTAVVSDVLQTQCSTLLIDFFKEKRQKI